ncbi:MAG TPA: response regulator transcription factor [Pyrinomonadaceae bacterium]|nr:response regulator transcription factor [Pyrinomonadaceae bacterium]
MENITIIIADDHPIVRKGLRETIEEESNFVILAEVNNGREAIEAIEKFSPKVTILDVDMPIMNGFDVAREIKSRKFPTEIIFMTMHRDEDMFNEAIDLGAKGFILKDSALGDIVECLKAVASKNHFTSHSLTSFLINRSRRAVQLTEKQPSINDLTPSERKVLKLIAENLTSKEIAENLFISLRTVEKHRENICQKLDLQGSHSLFKFAVQNKSKLL